VFKNGQLAIGHVTFRFHFRQQAGTDVVLSALSPRVAKGAHVKSFQRMHLFGKF
jgi:hypothetical protein